MRAGKFDLVIEQGVDFFQPIWWSSAGDTTKNQGVWDAAANSPAIPAAGAGNKDNWYTVSVPGNTTIDGISIWARNDIIVSSGAAWYKNSYPIDITGWTAKMQARTRKLDTIKLLDLTTENGGITIDGPNGKITLSISAAATAALSWRTAYYDLELTDPAGKIIRLIEGQINISREVTR